MLHVSLSVVDNHAKFAVPNEILVCLPVTSNIRNGVITPTEWCLKLTATNCCYSYCALPMLKC